jgi:hypothetical protein
VCEVWPLFAPLHLFMSYLIEAADVVMVVAFVLIKFSSEPKDQKNKILYRF